MMDQVLRDLPFVMVYLDDIVVFSKSKEEHVKHLRLVFKAVSNAGL